MEALGDRGDGDGGHGALLSTALRSKPLSNRSIRPLPPASPSSGWTREPDTAAGGQSARWPLGPEAGEGAPRLNDIDDYAGRSEAIADPWGVAAGRTTAPASCVTPASASHQASFSTGIRRPRLLRLGRQFCGAAGQAKPASSGGAGPRAERCPARARACWPNCKVFSMCRRSDDRRPDDRRGGWRGALRARQAGDGADVRLPRRSSSDVDRNVDGPGRDAGDRRHDGESMASAR